MSHDSDDLPSNTSRNPHFNDIAFAARSRRGFLRMGLGLGAVGFLGAGLAACGGGDDDGGNAGTAEGALGFTAIAANSGDAITVPTGYSHAVFCRWGDPLFANSPAWATDASNTAADQALQFGDNHDGMHFFPLTEGNSTEGLLVMNHEYFNSEYFFTPDVQSGATPWSLEQARKGQHAHGISVAHVRLVDGTWQVVIPSSYNRRIHLNTPMAITGPVKGHALVRTSTDANGELSYGTVNNCGNGFTEWGTYLTCEENFNGYFGTPGSTDTRSDAMKRYGLPSAGTEGYRWFEVDSRFDYTAEPNESNRFGWIVEIDPFDPTSTPKKRTALGRFKHENAAQTRADDNRVVVYMGDDQANDYIYKFVSDGKYDAATPALNRDLLETGTLYVARFSADAATATDMTGTGEWIPLLLSTPAVEGGTLANLFADMGELLVNTRLAADAVGATKMDRPEWVAVHPTTREGYCTLTNNSGRSETDAVNPRAQNIYGQIVHWRETGGDPAALTFEWDLFVMAGNPAHPNGGLYAGSENITADNLFNSPDGLAFDTDGRMWIQTDGNFSNTGNYAGMGNNQMLVANPGTGEIRRFLVGPSGCEITGITFTPDSKYVFVNVQHPGEYGSHPRAPEVEPTVDALAFSTWPEAAGGRPRSATVVIWKDDGGKVGT